MTERVVVSNAGSLPTARQMAVALAGELTDYFQPYWAGMGGSWWLRVPRLGSQLARRPLPPELAARARSFCAATELVRLGLGRAGLLQLDYRLIWRRNAGFDERVARVLPPGATVVSHYGASLDTFRRAGRAGGRAVLDYPIARLDFGQALLEEEARLQPGFADSISRRYALTLAPRELDRVAEEVRLADVVVVGSRFAAESFRGIVEPGRLAVAPYGVDTSAFSPRTEEPPPGPLRILFAGHLSLRKGVVYALEAMRLLDPGRFRLTLAGYVLGSGEGLRRYEGLHTHLTGVRPQDMPRVYRSADVVVVPSLVEGSALVVLEAMASGVPVIVTPNAGADAVRDGIDGFVVPIRAPAEIAERLERLAAGPELRSRMGTAARERALGYDWTGFRAAVRGIVLGRTATESAVLAAAGPA